MATKDLRGSSARVEAPGGGLSEALPLSEWLESDFHCWCCSESFQRGYFHLQSYLQMLLAHLSLEGPRARSFGRALPTWRKILPHYHLLFRKPRLFEPKYAGQARARDVQSLPEWEKKVVRSLGSNYLNLATELVLSQLFSFRLEAKIFVQSENSTAPSLELKIQASPDSDAGGSDRRVGVPQAARVNKPIAGTIPEFEALQH